MVLGPWQQRSGRLHGRRVLSTAAVGAALAGAIGAAALGAQPGGPSGRVVQPAGAAGCLHPAGLGNCARASAIRSPGAVAVSPDGRHVYVGGFDSNAVAVFTRDRRKGTLRQRPGSRGCVSHRGAGPCEFARALAAPTSVAVSPDGRNVYVAATGSDALAVFARNRRTGELRQLTGSKGCIVNLPGGGCRDGRVLNEPIRVIVSPAGDRVYVAGRQRPAGIAVFRRGRGGSLTQASGQAGCITRAGQGGCAVGRGLSRLWDLAASPDGRHVYAAASDSDAVSVFTRTPAGLAQSEGPDGCLARAGAEGCTPARALNGALGVTVSPDGRDVYVASIDSDAVALLRRDRLTGALTQPDGRRACVSQAGGGGCAEGRLLDGAHAARVSPDGRNVYVISEELDSLSVFARDRSSGRISQLPGRSACLIRGGVLGCGRARGLNIVVEVAISRDGRSVYVGSAGARGALAIFRRRP